MTHPVQGSVTWDGVTPAVETIHELLWRFTTSGALRVALQQIRLTPDPDGGQDSPGDSPGVHETIDEIADVGGNLVSLPLRDAVRADAEISAQLDAALARLWADVAADLGQSPDMLSVLLDADGQRLVYVTFDVAVTARELAERPQHPALHGGAHHIAHHAPALEDLRDRLAPPEPSRICQAWDELREKLRRLR